METQIKVRKKRQLHHDRIVLDQTTMEIILTMQDQIKDSLSEVVKIDTRKLVNFLLQTRSAALSSSELRALKEKHFDQVKALEWALQQAKDAKAGNRDLSIVDILKKLETPNVTEKAARKAKAKGTFEISKSPLPGLAQDAPNEAKALAK